MNPEFISGGFGFVVLLTENPFVDIPEYDCSDKLEYDSTGPQRQVKIICANHENRPGDKKA